MCIECWGCPPQTLTKELFVKSSLESQKLRQNKMVYLERRFYGLTLFQRIAEFFQVRFCRFGKAIELYVLNCALQSIKMYQAYMRILHFCNKNASFAPISTNSSAVFISTLFSLLAISLPIFGIVVKSVMCHLLICKCLIKSFYELTLYIIILYQNRNKKARNEQPCLSSLLTL